VRAANGAGASAYSNTANVFVGGSGLVLVDHDLDPVAPAVRPGETFVAKYQVTNGGSQPVAVDLRLGYRDQGGSTGILVGQGGAVSVIPGTAWYATTVLVPQAMAPGYYDLDWRVYAPGTQQLLVSLGSYALASLRVLAGAVGPRLAVGPTALDFGVWPVGQASDENIVEITNIGTSPLDVTGVRLDGAAVPECSAAGVFCLQGSFAPFALEPGATRTLSFVFRPDGPHAESAALTLDTNDPSGESRIVTLQGEGSSNASCQFAIRSVRVVSEPGETDPPLANRDATIYVQIQNTGPISIVGELVAEMSIVDVPGVPQDGFWVGRDGITQERQRARFSAEYNEGLQVDLDPGETTTIALQDESADTQSGSARLRFMSSHYSNRMDLTVSSYGECRAPWRGPIQVDPNPDSEVTCLTELVSVGVLGADIGCLAGTYSAADGMLGAAENKDYLVMGLALWDMGSAAADCAGALIPWVFVINFCRTAIDLWTTESNGNGCGGVVLDHGADLAEGMRWAAEHWMSPGTWGDGAFVVVSGSPQWLKVQGRDIGLKRDAVRQPASEDSIQVVDVGAARFIHIPQRLLGQLELSGFGQLGTQLGVDLLSSDGVRTSASYPEILTGPGTMVRLNLADPGNPLALEVDDDGDGTADFTIAPTLQDSSDVLAPSHVRDLQAAVDSMTVTLTWTNPPEADFESLMVRASEYGFPATTTMGREAFAASGLRPNEALDFSDNTDAYGTYFYSFFSVDSTGNTSSPETLRVVVTASSAVGGPLDGADQSSRIRRVAPNPLRTSTKIYYTLGASGPMSMEVFDVQGRRIAVLTRGPRAAAGFHVTEWNGRDDSGSRVASGIYVLRLVTADGGDSRRIVFLR
jgi:hypothetical protein